MPAITGLNGDVTFASGYTEDVASWEMNVFAVPQDKTAFQPSGDHQVLCASELLHGAEGRYTTKLCVTETPDITGTIYDPYPTMWVLNSQCEPQMSTSFQNGWHTWEPGLITTQFRMQTWIHDNTALPTGGNGTASLVVSDTQDYSVPYVALSTTTGVSVEGDRREVIVEGSATSEITTTGDLPYPAVEGSATLTAEGDVAYTADILITGVEVRVDRPAGEGVAAIDFVVNGRLDGYGGTTTSTSA